MKEINVIGRTLPEAYHAALCELQYLGHTVPCPDWNTEQKELAMTMIVTQPLAEPLISKLFIGGPKELEQYCMEMLDGILDFEIERGNWAYTYHDRYVNQYKSIIEELKRNPYSRRAVIDIRRPGDIESADPPCFTVAQFFIRNDKLDCFVLFRSNDACKATFMNAFALIMLQKRIADELNIEVGTYTHRANSFHCYARDYAMLEGYVNRLRHAKSLEDVTYDYVGDWDEQMAGERDAIISSVNKLKNS